MSSTSTSTCSLQKGDQKRVANPVSRKRKVEFDFYVQQGNKDIQDFMMFVKEMSDKRDKREKEKKLFHEKWNREEEEHEIELAKRQIEIQSKINMVLSLSKKEKKSSLRCESTT